MDAPVEAAREAVVGLDEDMAFQRREWWWQRLGRAAIGLFVLAACLGVLGGTGPLNRTDASAGDGSLTVEYDRFIRAGAPTIMRLTVDGAAADDCILSPAVFDEMQIQRIEPAPEEVVRRADGVHLRFAAPLADGSSVTIDAVATGPGRIDAWAALAGHGAVAFSPLAIF